MKPILVVKLGSTTPALAHRQGDFEDWITAGLGVPPAQVAVADPRQSPLPDPRQFAGVVLTGSHSMVTDHEAWSERTAQWIPAVVEANTPLLGICYGHQLIAYALGGEVGPNPSGRESGTVEITLRDEARTDPLFAELPTVFAAHVSHAQSVLRLPPGAIWLAASRREPHHAFALGPRTWGVQFHPEFNELAARTYVDACSGELRGQGDEPGQLQASIAATPHAAAVLRRFGELAR